MNLTIISLISTSITSHSPLYVRNNIKAINCHYHKFFSNIFYNQESFYIKGTKFQYGLNGVIRREFSTTTETITDPIYGTYNRFEYNLEDFNNAIKFEPGSKSSCSIIDCTFTNINQFGEYVIQVKGQASFYMSDSLIAHCSGGKDPISLNCRCNTLSHLCVSDIKTTYGSSFLNGNSQGEDFFILVYSSFVGNKKVPNVNNEETVIFAQSGYQFLRCINISNADPGKATFQIDASRCVSQSMITFSKIGGSLMLYSGSFSSRYLISEMFCAYDLQISDSINTDYKKNLFVLEVTNIDNLEYHLKNCVFIYEFTDRQLFRIKDGLTILIDFIGGSMSSSIRNDGSDKITIQTDSNFRKVDAGQITRLEIAHYTANDCPGVDRSDNKELAHECSVDKCLSESSHCNKTIGFPSDVAPYKTKFYPDLQTPTPSPTTEFTASNAFTTSDFFSKSFFFTKSSPFASSDAFTTSNIFTKSEPFPKSSIFTSSDFFSKSFFFTKSSPFASSDAFTTSNMFSKSSIFTSSNDFSTSNLFTKSSPFACSDAFSASNMFTQSGLLPKSSIFTASNVFTTSDYFSRSFYFSVSTPFTGSKIFLQTDTFKSSSTFTKSIAFTKSSMFTNSDKFISTKQFTKSSFFTGSKRFTESATFSPSKKFTQSNKFTPSTFFTKSSIFSQSEKFTLSNIFPHYHVPPQTPSKSISPSESKILTVDDDNSEYKCSVNIYIIYAQIIIIFFLIIILIILSILVHRKYHIKAKAVIEDMNEKETNNQDLDEPRTNDDDPFTLVIEESEFKRNAANFSTRDRS